MVLTFNDSMPENSANYKTAAYLCLAKHSCQYRVCGRQAHRGVLDTSSSSIDTNSKQGAYPKGKGVQRKAHGGEQGSGLRGRRVFKLENSAYDDRSAKAYKGNFGLVRVETMHKHARGNSRMLLWILSLIREAVCLLVPSTHRCQDQRAK